LILANDDANRRLRSHATNRTPACVSRQRNL
jgi:hypothetical protein